MHEEFLEGFESLGYARIAKGDMPIPYDGIGIDPRDRVYRHANSTTDAYHTAVLSYLPKAGAYSLTVSVYNPDAIEIARRLLSCITGYLTPGLAALGDQCLYYAFPIEEPATGRWRLLPNPANPFAWQSDLRLVSDTFLASEMWPIAKPQQLLALLLRSDGRFKWSPSLALQRLVNVIAVGRHAGVDSAQMKLLLSKHENVLAAAMKKGPAADSTVLVDKLLTARY